MGAIALSLGLVAYGELTDVSGSAPSPEGAATPSGEEGTVGRGRVETTLIPVGDSDTSGEVVAMIRLDGEIAKAAEFAHGGEEGPADELPGNIDQPVTAMGSADGTASVTSLLSGVTLDDVLAGEPMYLDLHAADTEDAPILACATLRA